MRHLLAIGILVFVISCDSSHPEAPIALSISEIVTPLVGPLLENDPDRIMDTEPYQLKLDLQKLEDNTYSLKVGMILNNGSYYVSPNAKRDFKGKFTLHIDDSQHLHRVSELVETPLSAEEYDSHPFVNGTVNWVRENTTYHQKIKVTTKDDFLLRGFIQFTIEPRCTLEKIPFFIKYYDGEMRVEVDRC